MFYSGVSFSGIFDSIELPYFHKPPTFLPWKFSGRPPALRHYCFRKTLHLKCSTVFWIRLCLDNCSVICTVTLCYVLHQAYSEFRHIQHCYFRYMSAYSMIFRVFKTYSHTLRHYSGILRIIQAYSALCNPCIFTTLPYSDPLHI